MKLQDEDVDVGDVGGGEETSEETSKKRERFVEERGKEDRYAKYFLRFLYFLSSCDSETNGDSSVRKRGREDDDDTDEHEAKKQKDVCFRCGGHGHYFMLCPSPRGSAESSEGPQCYKCHGRGHLKHMCPNNLPSNACYRCGVPGHRSRCVV